MIPVLSLFCGCGGMDLGFRMAGFDPILAIDISEAAIATYNWNRKRCVAKRSDLSSITGEEIVAQVREAAPNTRLRGVIGGPPCQSFSIGNVHQKEDDPRKELPLRYAEILSALNEEFQLDFFVFENVVGLRSDRHEQDLASFLVAFKEAGFNVFQEQLNARAFGVAQNRKRVFLVGINKQLYPTVVFKFPAGNPDNPKTVWKAIGGLPEPAFFNRKINRKDIPHHPNHWTMNPKSLKFTNGSSKSGRSFRKLKWDHPSWTVAYGHREIHVHPRGTRRISIFEAMLLQGLPAGYELRGNLTQQVEQISNAVPPPLARAIARAIRMTIYERTGRIQKNLLTWFGENERSFPWRKTNRPYRILLAEKLLQQTAATDQVVVAYERILSLYPTLQSLSEARSAVLREIIAPLGFSYRAEELPKLAKTIVRTHQNKVPRDLRDLLALPGVGDYMARAILSFAYYQDVPVVDTNIARLLRRVFGVAGPMPSNPARKRKLIDMATALVPKGKARDFNLAALDLCASICTARQPNCAECPIREECDYGRKALSPVRPHRNGLRRRK
jgi:DNA (cytosine-5)-methyltransferase 1